MHSSELRGTDFEVTVDGQPCPHGEYFRGFVKTDRLGVVASRQIGGAGAVTLILAYVTAFYDDYRRDNDEFFAYPDFFAFQKGTPLANYGMFDIWPEHKLVALAPAPETAASTRATDTVDASAALRAVNDRGVQVLIVPDKPVVNQTFDNVALASARRRITTCYAYDFSGQVNRADVIIRCNQGPKLIDWVAQMFQSISHDQTLKASSDQWLATQSNGKTLEQSFRRITLDEALARL
ncbi:MAG: hypothetical protein QF785_02355 [Phycisphaeraceae bacterium]|jgi:hypothetical protein|nr:hypothetical protein [Phycisphaeraceae bacterium]